MSISKRNRRGLFWLAIFSTLVIISPRIINRVFFIEKPIISTEEVIQFQSEKLAEDKNNEAKKRKTEHRKKYKRAQSRFNPNDFELDDWMKLGLSSKQAEVIVNFSKRGLKSNDDLRKIFVLPSELFELIKDSTTYKVNGSKNYVIKHDEGTKSDVVVDLNLADEKTLLTVPGIGPFYASKIIEHRNKLGGFVDKVQLLELWKFDQLKFEEVKNHFIIKENNIVKLDINKASIDELKSHPYISYSVANSIVKMRLQSNNFENLTDIKRSKLINEELYNKIEPYIKLK